MANDFIATLEQTKQYVLLLNSVINKYPDLRKYVIESLSDFDDISIYDDSILCGDLITSDEAFYINDKILELKKLIWSGQTD